MHRRTWSLTASEVSNRLVDLLRVDWDEQPASTSVTDPAGSNSDDDTTEPWYSIASVLPEDRRTDTQPGTDDHHPQSSSSLEVLVHEPASPTHQRTEKIVRPSSATSQSSIPASDDSRSSKEQTLRETVKSSKHPQANESESKSTDHATPLLPWSAVLPISVADRDQTGSSNPISGEEPSLATPSINRDQHASLIEFNDEYPADQLISPEMENPSAALLPTYDET